MPTQQQSKELQPVSDKEVRLATAVKALSDRERAAYKYFVQNETRGLTEQVQEQLFSLYQRGTSCEEIRRLFPIYGLGQIVAARVMWNWDERSAAQSKQLQVEVPRKVETVQLETQEFLANILHAVHKRSNDALRMYIATSDESHLASAGIALPKTVKELKDLIETYGKISGTDTKKIEVKHTGQVTHVARVSAEEATSIMDDLLEGDIIDVTPEPPKQIEAAPPAPPQTPEEKIEFLVKSGMPREKAEELVRG
jgi:hypothetical protein